MHSFSTYHRHQVDEGVGFIQTDQQCRLTWVFALLLLHGILRHVQLDLAKVRLEEHGEPLYTDIHRPLIFDVCVRVWLLWRMRMAM